MSSDVLKKPSWLRRGLLAVLAIFIVLVLALFSLRLFVKTESGARWIETQVNSRSFGPIERIEISGLSGDPLDAFSLDSAKVFDKNGILLTANNIDIKWSPWSLRRKAIDLKSITIKSSELLRRPVLNETQSKEPSSLSFGLKSYDIKSFKLSQEVMGQSAIFTLQGGLQTDKSGAVEAKLEAKRSDSHGDRLNLDFTKSATGNMLGNFDLMGKAGGTLSALLKSPAGANVTGEGQLLGRLERGEGRLSIDFDGEAHIDLQGRWSEAAANLNGQVNTAGWELFDEARSGLGDEVSITAALDRTLSPSGFEVGVSSMQILAKASGQLGRYGVVPNRLTLSARSDDLGAILPLPGEFNLGAGKVNGRADIKPGYKFTGDISLNDVQTPYGKAGSIAGPIELSQTGNEQYKFVGDLLGLNLTPNMKNPIVLSDKTLLKIETTLNTKTSEVTELEAVLLSGENRITANGNANYTVSKYDISGSAALSLLQIGNVPAGQIQTDYSVMKTASSGMAVSINGAFKPSGALSAPSSLLLEGGINFDVDMAPIQGGLEIKKAVANGPNIRAAVSGTVTDRLDLQGEAFSFTPLAFSPLTLSGETAASFTVTGERANPNVRLDARASDAVISGYALANARIRAELSDIVNAPKGPLRLTAETAQGPLDLSANFASRDQLYAANDIDIKLGGLSAAGMVSKAAGERIIGELVLNLPKEGAQYARAKLSLFAKGGEQGLSVDADVKNIAYNAFAFDSLKVSAEGTLDSLSGKFAAKGQRQLKILERQFYIEAPLTASRSEGGMFEVSLSPEAQYGNISLKAKSPVIAKYLSGDVALEAPLVLAGTPFLVSYKRKAAAETLAVKTAGLPVSIIPMPGNLADTRGSFGIDMKIATSLERAGVVGGGSISLKDWRGFDMKSDNGLSGDLVLDLRGNALGWQLNALSAEGFNVSSEGRIPLLQGTSLTDLRPSMNSPLSGKFAASGQASAVLGLFTPSDAKPSGELSANIRIAGTAAKPLVEGEANGQALRMEAPDLGTQLRDGRFTANFTNDTLQVSNVSISDSGKGKMKGQGQFKLGEFGRPIGELNMVATGFRALNRKDLEGTVSGSLDLVSDEDKATVTGEVTLNRAEVKQFITGGASVVEIPVEEINKPKDQKVIPTRSNTKPLFVDVKLLAPRRIFVRSKGLDVELSIDAAIKGNLEEPEIFGSASVLRGGYKIAGKTLRFENGAIDFYGPLGEARVSLIANADTQNISATVKIVGTVAKPEIELSSTPDRPQDEILSALLFERSATELSTIEAAQLAGALAQFSGAGGGFDLMGGLRDALGVGQLSIGVGEDGGAKIAGGRYLAKNVYLQVFSGAGSGQTGAIINWEVRRNVLLTSKIQADNDQSFALRWKKDF